MHSFIILGLLRCMILCSYFLSSFFASLFCSPCLIFFPLTWFIYIFTMEYNLYMLGVIIFGLLCWMFFFLTSFFISSFRPPCLIFFPLSCLISSRWFSDYTTLSNGPNICLAISRNIGLWWRCVRWLPFLEDIITLSGSTAEAEY